LPYDVPAGWFQVATSYAGAVAFVEKRTEPGHLRASGVLVDAHLLNPDWNAKPVFVTGTYVLAKDRSDFPYAMTPTETQIVVLGPKNEQKKARLGAVLWQSDNLGVSVSSIEDELPPEAAPIKSSKNAPSVLSNLDTLSPADVDASFDDRALLKVKGRQKQRPIVFIGHTPFNSEVTLSISHLLGKLAVSGLGDPKALPNTPSNSSCVIGRACNIGPVPVSNQVRADLVYTYGTPPGGGGSPIFDAETGDLIGIHLMGYPCPQGGEIAQHCSGAGTSLARLLTAIRGQ
jgi:hypothetical protein